MKQWLDKVYKMSYMVKINQIELKYIIEID